MIQQTSSGTQVPSILWLYHYHCVWLCPLPTSLEAARWLLLFEVSHTDMIFSHERKILLFKKIFLMFIFERQWDRAQMGEEGQRERETQNPKQVPGSELSAHSSRAQTYDLSLSWTLHRLSHPGALFFFFFNFLGFSMQQLYRSWNWSFMSLPFIHFPRPLVLHQAQFEY